MIYRIQPLQDPRWADFVDGHPQSSAFHSVPWLQALTRTYHFQPVVYTTSPPEAPLQNALLFCRVQSALTHSRLVSVPFSDHCEPLVDDPTEFERLTQELQKQLPKEFLRYIELRAKTPIPQSSTFSSTRTYCFHELDLRPPLDVLFTNLHKSSTQQKVHRAQREGLAYECGQSQNLFDVFFDLLTATRRRHGVPPQPRAWFQNLIECFAEALQIRVAFHGRRPAAAILTLRHKQTLTYKYGCSDTDLNHLGGTQLLFWRAIQEAKRDGLLTFDLGRSDCDQTGLITFKDRLGATRSILTYTRLLSSPHFGAFHDGPGWKGRTAKWIVSILPHSALRLAGRLLYKHFA